MVKLHYTHLRHLCQAGVSSMLLKTLVLPEERTWHGSGYYQNVEQCPTHYGGTQTANGDENRHQVERPTDILQLLR